MSKITKLALTLALLVAGVGGANAEKVNADLSKYGDKWDGSSLSFSWTATYGNQLLPALDLPTGDLTSWEKLVVVVDELTNCDFFRVLVYNGDDTNHSNTFKATKTGTNEFTLSGNVDNLDKVTKIVLSGSNGEDSKNGTWSTTPASFKVSAVYLERPDDPLSVPKDNLSKAISKGEMQSALGKTAASFSTLTAAIDAGKTELASGTATVESLINAKDAIENAIAGLKLEAGYVKLTAAMFKKYASVDAPGEGSTAYPAYELNVASDLPYGDSYVGELNWADLTAYDKLIVVTSGTIKPRICMNRLENGGQQAATQEESKMLDINPNNSNTWSTEKYQTIDDNVYTIDLKSIVSDYNFARLHCIKKQGWGDGVIVTDLLLQAAPVTVTIGVSGFATFSAALNTKIAGATAYAAKYDGSKVVLTEVTEVPAGSGVIIEAVEGKCDFPVLNEAAAIENNDLKVSDGSVAGDGSIYALANGTNGVGFYKVGTGVSVPAGKAYLQIAAGGRDFIGFDGAATGIQIVKEESADNGIYNLSGQRVAKAQKGLYIVNGKKVVIK